MDFLKPSLLILLFLFTVRATAANAAACTGQWQLWNAYAGHFIQSDGRVIEHSQKGRTTSEGQAYSLFHALVANDRQRFDKILAWTRDNLAAGDLSRHLPAWLWGQDDRGHWGILDANTASDADMWLAYALLEAGRLWNRPELRRLGKAVLHNIEIQDIRDLPGLGKTVLPGREGFQLDAGRWKLNPSYLPLQLLRRFSRASSTTVWDQVIVTTRKMLLAAGATGIVPDWIVYDRHKGFTTLPNESIGSYDAIRVYLWLGMLNDADPLKARFLNLLDFTNDSFGLPPEKIDTRSRMGAGKSPIGFKAALAPFFKSKQAERHLHRTIRMIDSQWKNGLLTDEPRYYDQNLALFALAWLEKRFRFEPDGRLTTQWETPCTDAAGNPKSSLPAG